MSRISAIVDDIDAGRLQLRTHEVARRLAQHETRSRALGAEVLAAFDVGSATGNHLLLEKLWDRIEGTPVIDQGCFRTLVSLLQPNERLDGHHAEYLIGWAQDEGVPLETIETAFRGS